MNNDRPQNHTAQPVTSAATVTTEASPLDELMVKPMQRYNLALEPQGDDAAWKIAQACADANLCGCKTPGDAYIRIIAGRAIGLPAMASVHGIVPIWNAKAETNTLTMYVKTKLSLCLSRPDIIEYIRPTEMTNEKAVWVGKRVGGEEQKYEFTMEDAIQAGLVSRGKDDAAKQANNYNKHPKPMLTWRAGGRLIDLIAGDILNGIASYEDMSDEATEEERQAAQDRRDGIVPEAVKGATPVRNWASETGSLKAEIEKSYGNPEAMKVLRRRIKAFGDEAPTESVAELETFYNGLKKAKGGNGGPPGGGNRQRRPHNRPRTRPGPPRAQRQGRRSPSPPRRLQRPARRSQRRHRRSTRTSASYVLGKLSGIVMASRCPIQTDARVDAIRNAQSPPSVRRETPAS